MDGVNGRLMKLGKWTEDFSLLPSYKLSAAACTAGAASLKQSEAVVNTITKTMKYTFELINMSIFRIWSKMGLVL